MNHTPSKLKLNVRNIHPDQVAQVFKEYFLNLVDSLKLKNFNMNFAISLL